MGLLQDLERGTELLLDGGMGQELAARGVDTTQGLWSAQALRSTPETVLAVHRDFIAAGADIITTNSYATTRRRLEDHGQGDAFADLNRRAGELARQASEEAGREVLVAGSLPPIHGSYRPERVPRARELEPAYREQAEALAEHVDLFLGETLSTTAEAVAVAGACARLGKPVWISWTVADDGSGLVRGGDTIPDAVADLAGERVDALLLNCSMPESIEAAMRLLSANVRVPYGAYANGFTAIGADHDVADGANVPGARDDLDPERYAEWVSRWLDNGARIVGGCCEVGPAHVARLRRLIDERQG